MDDGNVIVESTVRTNAAAFDIFSIVGDQQQIVLPASITQKLVVQTLNGFFIAMCASVDADQRRRIGLKIQDIVQAASKSGIEVEFNEGTNRYRLAKTSLQTRKQAKSSQIDTFNERFGPQIVGLQNQVNIYKATIASLSNGQLTDAIESGKGASVAKTLDKLVENAIGLRGVYRELEVIQGMREKI